MRIRMNVLNKNTGLFPFGVWMAIAALLLLFLAWGMQAYSLLNWDDAVDLGLQEDRFTGDAAERALAKESRGVAVADMLWPLPVGIVALAGILKRRFYGFAAGLMEFSIGVYFPIFYAFQRWATNPETVIVAIFMWMIPSLLGIIGLWANREYFKE